jgi:hypothetical protein
MPNPPVVRLGTLTFNNGPDADGDEFIASDVDGWNEIPVELVTVERPIADGAVIVRGRYQAKALTVVGVGIGANEDAVWRVRSKLAAASALATASANFEVDEPGATYRLVVRVPDRIRIRPLANVAVEFEIPLLAADPHKTTVP